MDQIDIKIIRELTQAQTILPARPGLQSSYRDVARKLGIPAGTVRNRINGMYSSGIIVGSSVYPNPNLLGLKVDAYAIDISQPKRDAVERLKLIDGVIFIQDFHRSLAGIVFVYDDERSLSENIGLIDREASGAHGIFTRVFYPDCDASLSKADWLLVARLTKREFRTFGEFAKNAGVSVRSLKRRLARLTAEKAILSVPTMDYRAIAGSVPADLIVSFASPEARNESEPIILEQLSDLMIYAGVWGEFGMYSLVLPRVFAATELVESVGRIRGVSTTRIEFVDDHIDMAYKLGQYVESRVLNVSPREEVEPLIE